jgi:hypothetical protein
MRLHMHVADPRLPPYDFKPRSSCCRTLASVTSLGGKRWVSISEVIEGVISIVDFLFKRYKGKSPLFEAGVVEMTGRKDDTNLTTYGPRP